MVAIVWDSSLQFHSVMFARRSLSKSGGQTISGVEQVVQSATDFWAAKVPTFVPLPGMFFSIDNRLYLIGTVTYTGTVRTYTVTFAPGLRVDAATGTSIEFSSPRCLMRLAEDNIGDMDLDMLRFADITLSFVEVPA
jgi:hypothetical protein